MANASKFSGCNMVMHRPEGMTEEECGDLPVLRVPSAFVSCWQLTPEEIKQVQETGRVYVWVFGDAHPPISVSAFSPAKEQDLC